MEGDSLIKICQWWLELQKSAGVVKFSRSTMEDRLIIFYTDGRMCIVLLWGEFRGGSIRFRCPMRVMLHLKTNARIAILYLIVESN